MNRTTEIEVREKGAQDTETGPVLSRDHRDQIRWTARARGRDFTICFNHNDGHKTKSPFQDEHFEVTYDNPAISGPVREDAEDGDYHYEIKRGLVDCPTVGMKSPKVRIKP